MAERGNNLPIYRPGQYEYRTAGLPHNVGNDIYHSPRTEARALLPLLKLPRESVETIRALISVSPAEENELRKDERDAEKIIRFRQKTLQEFERLVVCPPKRKRKIAHRTKIPAETCAEILRLFKLGHSIREVHALVKCGFYMLNSLSMESGQAFEKKVRGHRLSPETKNAICDALQSGHSAVALAKQYGTTHKMILIYRKRLGINVDLRRHQALNTAQIARATQMLEAGSTWAQAAREFGVAIRTIIRFVPYRKRAKRLMPQEEICA